MLYYNYNIIYKTIYNIMHAEGNITCRSIVEKLYI